MSNQLPGCPICGESLALSLAHGRKSGKPFIMLRCLKDGRHFRGFITYQPYVMEMLNKAETLKLVKGEGSGIEAC
jgi:hypothetical protein